MCLVALLYVRWQRDLVMVAVVVKRAGHLRDSVDWLTRQRTSVDGVTPTLTDLVRV